MTFEFADSVLDAISILFPQGSLPSAAREEADSEGPAVRDQQTAAPVAEEPALPTDDASLDLPQA